LVGALSVGSGDDGEAGTQICGGDGANLTSSGSFRATIQYTRLLHSVAINTVECVTLYRTTGVPDGHRGRECGGTLTLAQMIYTKIHVLSRWSGKHDEV